MMKAEEECVWWYCCDELNYKQCKLINLMTRELMSFCVPYKTQHPYAAIQIGHLLYFTGGGEASAGVPGIAYFSEMRSIDFQEFIRPINNKLASMKIPRAYHTFVALSPASLYVIGGKNSTGLLRACEEYSVELRKWTDKASLNEAKKQASVTAFNNRYLYAFGGEFETPLKVSSMIECLDCTQVTATKWLVIKLSAGADLWHARSLAGCYTIGPDTILVWGGNGGEESLKDTLAFNPKSNQFVAKEGLSSADMFSSSMISCKYGSLWAVGVFEGMFYEFNLASQTWKTLQRSSWNPLPGSGLKSDTF